MHIQTLSRLFRIPVLREVLGAGIGAGIALFAYQLFLFATETLNEGIVASASAQMHAAASLVGSAGTAGIGIGTSLFLAASCAALQCRMHVE